MVDRIAALAAGGHRPSKRELPELTSLLTSRCVQPPDAPDAPSAPSAPGAPGAPARPARRDLVSTGRPPVTLATAVGVMRRSFAEVTDVTAAVEAVWAAVGPPLDAAEAELASSRPKAASLGPEAETAFRDAEAALEALRSASNADPLALLQDGRVDTSAADRLQAQAAELCTRIGELDRLRSQGRSRIDALAAAARAAGAADRSYYDQVRAADAADQGSISFPAYLTERRFPLAGPVVRIGRRSSKSPHQSDVDLTGPPIDPGVSRQHAEPRLAADGGWSVIDLDSPNGIQVNGKDVPSGAEIPVTLGDQIHLGAWTLITLTRTAP